VCVCVCVPLSQRYLLVRATSQSFVIQRSSLYLCRLPATLPTSPLPCRTVRGGRGGEVREEAGQSRWNEKEGKRRQGEADEGGGGKRGKEGRGGEGGKTGERKVASKKAGVGEGRKRKRFMICFNSKASTRPAGCAPFFCCWPAGLAARQAHPNSARILVTTREDEMLIPGTNGLEPLAEVEGALLVVEVLHAPHPELGGGLLVGGEHLLRARGQRQPLLVGRSMRAKDASNRVCTAPRAPRPSRAPRPWTAPSPSAIVAGDPLLTNGNPCPWPPAAVRTVPYTAVPAEPRR